MVITVLARSMQMLTGQLALVTKSSMRNVTLATIVSQDQLVLNRLLVLKVHSNQIRELKVLTNVNRHLQASIKTFLLQQLSILPSNALKVSTVHWDHSHLLQIQSLMELQFQRLCHTRQLMVISVQWATIVRLVHQQ